MKKKIIVPSSARNCGRKVAGIMSMLAAQAGKPLLDLGYEITLCFTNDASDDDTGEQLRRAAGTFPGTVRLFENDPRKFRGASFLFVVQNACDIVSFEEEDAIIFCADLWGKAPHDPKEYAGLVSLLEEDPERVVFGSQAYGADSLDKRIMQYMTGVQHFAFGADGVEAGVWNSGLMIGRVGHFRKALQNFRVYQDNWSSYVPNKEWPLYGIPGAFLNMIAVSGAKLFEVVLPEYGEWRPCRTRQQLEPYFWDTIDHLSAVRRMRTDGLFTA
jgi:hypothetical protein